MAKFYILGGHPPVPENRQEKSSSYAAPSKLGLNVSEHLPIKALELDIGRT
jgi:hypothetical protein